MGEPSLQIYEQLSVLFKTLSKGHQILQSIKETLTSNPLFNPLSMFRYVARKDPFLTKKHFLAFLQQNGIDSSEQEIKGWMLSQNGKEHWKYEDFLQYVYPFNSAILRQVSNVHLKKYTRLQKYPADQESVTAFFLLISEELSLFSRLQVQKSDSILRLPRQKLRKVLKSIKRAGDKQPNYNQKNNEQVVTSVELRNFMRAFGDMDDSQFLYLGRKLRMQKGAIKIDQLEVFIRSWKLKSKKSYGVSPLKSSELQPSKPNQQRSNDKQLSITPTKEFNEKQYKDQLYQQLAATLNLGKKQTTRKSTGRKEESNFKQFNNKIQEVRLQNKAETFASQVSPLKETKPRTPTSLFLSFIDIFLSTSHQLDSLKLRLTSFKIDYFALFKHIDRDERGVVSADDLRLWYEQMGGRGKLQFDLWIERWAQGEDDWISLSQFCQGFKKQSKEDQNGWIQKNQKKHEGIPAQAQRLMMQIMELTICSQNKIRNIRNSFHRHESKYLFSLINKENTGFINYQQLKRFLADQGVSLLMHDLMTILKRLDRSKNGVVIESEFVGYFQERTF